MRRHRTGSAGALLADLRSTIAAGGVGATGHKTELARVLALPRVEPVAVDLTANVRRPGGTWSLRPIQSLALLEVYNNDGLFAPIKVGGGKTLIVHLVPVVLRKAMALIFTTAGNVKGMNKAWERDTKPNFYTRPIQVRSYHMLSTDTSLLERYYASYGDNMCIVCDEAHKLRNFEASRTGRMARFLKDHPGVAFVALTGTPAKSKLQDFAHLADWALGQGSPLPRPNRSQDLEWFGEALNVHTRASYDSLGYVVPLCEWAGDETFADMLEQIKWDRRNGRQTIDLETHGDTVKNMRRRARRAFNVRLRSCPGVVTSQADDGYKGELRIVARDLEIPDVVSYHIATTGLTDTKPNGDAIADDADEWRTFRQLGCGFYLVWRWPDPANPDTDWLEARREWHRYVRAELRSSRAEEGYDSTMHVTNRIRKEADEGRKREIHKAWREWDLHREKRFFGDRKPPTAAIWVDGFLIADAVQWAMAQDEPVILWYTSRAIGIALETTGIPVFGAGTSIAEWPDRGSTCAASIATHGTGKNLQWCRLNLVLEPPSSGEVWEQLIGREHRPGQPAESVEWHVYQHMPGFENAVNKARKEAVFLEDTTGYPYKLTIAKYVGFSE